MKHIAVTVAILMAVSFAACSKNTNSPTQSTTTTTVAAATTTTSSTTTTTSVPSPTTFTLTGQISDATTNRGIGLADVEIIEGANLGRTFRSDATGFYTVGGLSAGSFTMRVRATGYPSWDVRATITNANLRVDIQIPPLPPSTTTTTTTVPSTKADFFWTPDPCNISGTPVAVLNCTVDASTSLGSIASLKWTYLGRSVLDNARFVPNITCPDIPGGATVTVDFTLTITDTNGATDSVTKSVPIEKHNACGFP